MATLTTEHLDVCVQKMARAARRFGFHPDQFASLDRVGARC
jgi:hypothetical protein